MCRSKPEFQTNLYQYADEYTGKKHLYLYTNVICWISGCLEGRQGFFWEPPFVSDDYMEAVFARKFWECRLCSHVTCFVLCVCTHICMYTYIDIFVHEFVDILERNSGPAGCGAMDVQQRILYIF